MKTPKYPKLWQRLGAKALKKELRPCPPIAKGSRAGVGHCLTEGSEYAATPCVACGRPLGFGRLTSIDLNPNLPRGHWRMMHLAHDFRNVATGSTHEQTCQFCQTARQALEAAQWLPRLEQGIYDAYDAERECCAEIGHALACIGDPVFGALAATMDEAPEVLDDESEPEETQTVAVA
jgi:hypothetical protein